MPQRSEIDRNSKSSATLDASYGGVSTNSEMHIVFNDDDLVTNMHNTVVEAVMVKSEAIVLKRSRGSSHVANGNRNCIKEHKGGDVIYPNLNDRVRKIQKVTWAFNPNDAKHHSDDTRSPYRLRSPNTPQALSIKATSPVGLLCPVSNDSTTNTVPVDATATTLNTDTQQSPSSPLTPAITDILRLKDLLDNPVRGTARLRKAMIYCHDKTNWREYIAEDALPFIRNALYSRSAELKLSRFDCTIWPDTTRPNVLSVREVCEVLCDVFRIWQLPKDLDILNQKLDDFIFRFSNEDNRVGTKSCREFLQILKNYYGLNESIPAVRQDDICKIFYKKLPSNNNIATKFLSITKEAVKRYDTVDGMFNRLSWVLSGSRRIVLELGP